MYIWNFVRKKHKTPVYTLALYKWVCSIKKKTIFFVYSTCVQYYFWTCDAMDNQTDRKEKEAHILLQYLATHFYINLHIGYQHWRSCRSGVNTYLNEWRYELPIVAVLTCSTYELSNNTPGPVRNNFQQVCYSSNRSFGQKSTRHKQSE